MILYKYFAKEVFFTMFAVAGVVLVISMGWRFSGYLNQAASGTLTRDILFLIMGYRLPGFLEMIIPVSFFLAIMLSYGRLHVDSEMVVLESCGMSPLKLIAITLGLSAIVMLFAAVTSLWLKPHGEAEVEILFADQRNKTEFDMLAPGRFQTLRSGARVTYAERLDGKGELAGVFINEQVRGNVSSNRDTVTVQADRGATIVDANGNRFLVLKEGTRYNGVPGTRDYQVILYEEYGQLIEKQQAPRRERRRTAIPTGDLIEAPTTKNLSELQWRISVVLMIPVIGVMAIPLSRVNPRQGRYTRLVPGMILCFLYIVSLSAARSAIEKGQFPLLPGLGWVHGIYLVIVFCLFRLEWFTGLFRVRKVKKVSI
ncbi:MAG: LPS export ABC transporter permease LptF [Pseudomonadales bacterium]|nr:LPS export ABC transporter permease LptF [Pseudomonadales bacterium]